MHIIGNIINQIYPQNKIYRAVYVSSDEDFNKSLVSNDSIEFIPIKEIKKEIYDCIMIVNHPSFNEYKNIWCICNIPLVQILTEKCTERREHIMIYDENITIDYKISTNQEIVDKTKNNVDKVIDPFNMEEFTKCLKTIKNLH